jgi:hypothetical protein
MRPRLPVLCSRGNGFMEFDIRTVAEFLEDRLEGYSSSPQRWAKNSSRASELTNPSLVSPPKVKFDLLPPGVARETIL